MVLYLIPKTFLSFSLRNHLRCYNIENEINYTCLYYLHLSDLEAATEVSALEEIDDVEALSIPVPSAIPPASTSLRDYVDQSETLSKLVQLGNKPLNLKIVNINNILHHSYLSCIQVYYGIGYFVVLFLIFSGVYVFVFVFINPSLQVSTFGSLSKGPMWALCC